VPVEPWVVNAVREALGHQGVTVPDATLHAFLTELDPTYFEREKPEDIALHARLAAELRPERRARLAVTPREEGQYDVAVVAFDYFAELSILCGLLAARGLDIASGHVHTLVPAPGPAAAPARGHRRPRPESTSRRIVDVFRVRPRKGGAPEAVALEHELCALLDLVSDGRAPEARERIHLSLVETLEAAVVPRSSPGAVEIRFRNGDTKHFTTMEVRGPDAPGFLYALSNALAMRGIYIHEVHIESVAGEVLDVFGISHRDGRLLQDAAEQESLRKAVTLIRHFISLLPGAPDPGRALRYFDQLLDRTADLPGALEAFSTPEALHDLARFLGSSAFLWEDLVRDRVHKTLPVLASWRSRPLRTRAELRTALRERLLDAPRAEHEALFREFRNEETLLIETKRLLDPFLDLERFSWALADLGEALVAEALWDERAAFPVLCALGLGKFGGREMGHASDLELLFVYDDERTGAAGEAIRPVDDRVRASLGLLAAPEGALFHVDLRLRPHGSKGALASPLRALRDYYRPSGDAAPFERQALIKLRFVAGDEALGREVVRLRDEFVWSAEPWDREASVHLRERQARELVPPGRFNVKMSRGGLVDAEYTVQYMQIVHGREHPFLRTHATLPALDRLRTAEILESDEYESLREGYLFWREVVDALRVVRGHAGDLLLPDEASDEYGFLARRLGYPGGRRQAGSALARKVAHNRERLAAIYDRRFKG
jgi:glutamate-ammonia-ligase adenylyltransferase